MNCSTSLVCDTCAFGFNKLTQNILGFFVTICSEICGDGRRFESQCDDGNLINGDGCNSLCAI
jgi:cysteine-rich repeat protein